MVRELEAEHVVDEDRPVEVGLGEAVGAGRSSVVVVALLEAERVEVGVEMAAHAVGADHHQGADRIARRLQDARRRVTATPSGRALALTLSPTLVSIGPQLPSSAATSSPFGASGQSAAPSTGRARSSRTSSASSSRRSKKACHSASTAFGSLA